MTSVGELVCVNIVAVCNIGVRIDIDDLVYRLGFVYLQPQEFPAAAIHFENPRLTFLVSSMGKIVIIGSQNRYANILAARYFITILDYPNARIKSMQIQNYTCTHIFNGVLDLPRLAAMDPQRVKYIPYKIKSACVNTGVGRITHALWASGRVTVTGAKSEIDAIKSMNDNIAFYNRFVVDHVDEAERQEMFKLEMDDVDEDDMEEFIKEIAF
jgi:TATA-box binding protein (TBP) (component of TFIID and TFIIIB)